VYLLKLKVKDKKTYSVKSSKLFCLFIHINSDQQVGLLGSCHFKTKRMDPLYRYKSGLHSTVYFHLRHNQLCLHEYST